MNLIALAESSQSTKISLSILKKNLLDRQSWSEETDFCSEQGMHVPQLGWRSEMVGGWHWM